jgi:hypothetical protein
LEEVSQQGGSRFRAELDCSQQSNLNKKCEQNRLQLYPEENQLPARFADALSVSCREDVCHFCARFSFL